MPQLELNYAEPYRNLQIKVKEYIELMEERRFEEATKLAIAMHDLTHSLLYITNQYYITGVKNGNGQAHEANGSKEEYEWKAHEEQATTTIHNAEIES